jgi:hypothetical protein
VYTPSVYAPDLIAPAHPFGIYAPGTTPDPLGFSTLPDHAADATTDNEEPDYEEALEAELRAEALLDAADVRAAATYEAGVWRELRGRGQGAGAASGGPSRRARKRHAGAEMDGDGAHSMRLQKRRKGAFEGGGYVPVPVVALE